MSDVDADYFYRRAEAELEQAQRADHPAAVRVHFSLANAYLERLSQANDKKVSGA